jgi:hypothetical protein
MLLAALLVVGCASARFTDWTGHRIDEVIKKFGPPTRTVPTSDGGRMCVWEFQRSAPASSWGAGAGGPAVVTSANNYVSTKTFWVKPDGTVASWNSSD